MVDRVAIVSIAQVNYKEKLAYAPEELAYAAIKPVLEETGLGFGPAYEKGGIDASLVCHEHTRIMRPFSASQFLEAVGANLRPDEKVDQDGALGVYEAVWQIASGDFETVLVVSACHDSVNRDAGNAIENLVFDPFYHRPLGLDNCNTAALQATRYMHRYGITREQCAKVAVKNLRNAKSNPLALVAGDFSVEEILASELVAYPITRMETRPFADGACVMLLANEEKAKRLTSKPVWIKGLANCCDGYFIGDRDLSESEPLVLAARKAYKMAGITDVLKEIDLAEITDEFSYQELLEYEGLGFCEKGEGGRFIDSGATRLGGVLPVNPSGGVLSGCAHTNIGIARIFEVVMQLRGEAGERQVEEARTGLAHLAAGPCGQLQQVMILGNRF